MDLNQLISHSLRIGVLASAVLSLVGLSIWSTTGFGDLITTSGSNLSNTIASAFSGNSGGLIYLAVVVLIATPVFRVALSTLYFVRGRDTKYVIITLAVLSMLIFALVSGASSG